MMIVVSSEPCAGARVVHLAGALDASDDPTEVVERIVREAGTGPLVVDLTGLTPPVGPEVGVLLEALARAPARSATVLVHPDLATRRALRAVAGGLPVVPSNDLALHGRFAAAIAAEANPGDA